MTNQQKFEFWTNHFKQWKAGSLTREAYCKKHGLSVASFGNWRTKVKRAQQPNKLIPVITKPTQSSDPNISVVLKDGVRIEAPLALLSDVLRLIQTGQA
ncbi:IS66 family insertion sequence element accessory protein TnpA [Litoribacillus peritrichatus]|uniref:Transposase n=1 Tax=Litoribacillus peritrichatus TaxID=718191 RepID=A0ABP7MQX6_9GAMM